MKVMILAAGVGERMRPLTDHTPKPLLQVAGLPLIAHHLQRLAAAGFTDIVINVSHLGQQIIDFCGDGSRWNVSIVYSMEEEPLETAGGILKAMPLLLDVEEGVEDGLKEGGNSSANFLVVNGDVWTDYPFESLRGESLRSAETARLVFVGNPPQHTHGDFLLDEDCWAGFLSPGTMGVTYAGIGIYSQPFFATPPAVKADGGGKLALRPFLDAAIAQRSLGGVFYEGIWEDVGTPERLEALNAADPDSQDT